MAHLRSAPLDSHEARSPRAWRSAMTDHLDRAIDRVAAEMTRVDDNDVLAAQIIRALPDRAMWRGWLFQSWVPRLATIAIVVASGIVWANRQPVTVTEIAPLGSREVATPPAAFFAVVREAEPNRTTR